MQLKDAVDCLSYSRGPRLEDRLCNEGFSWFSSVPRGKNRDSPWLTSHCFNMRSHAEWRIPLSIHCSSQNVDTGDLFSFSFLFLSTLSRSIFLLHRLLPRPRNWWRDANLVEGANNTTKPSGQKRFSFHHRVTFKIGVLSAILFTSYDHRIRHTHTSKH